MYRRRRIGISLVRLVFVHALLTALISVTYGENSTVEGPAFSSKAVYMNGGRAAVSPDGQKNVVIQYSRNGSDDDFPADVFVEIGNATLTAKIQFGLNAEVLWSPDSDAFTVTGSREGAGGPYLTDVFIITANSLRKIPLSEIAWRSFGHPVKCGWPEYPNVGAVKWIQPSQRLLLAAQIIGHSNCDSFFTFKAYEVEIPSRSILRSYGQLQAKKLFKQDLGTWLIAAPDKCIRNPRACWVATNHPELKSP